MPEQARSLRSPLGNLDAVHEFTGHAGAAEFVGNLQVQSHGEVLVGFHGHAVGHDAVEHQAVSADFTVVELDGLRFAPNLFGSVMRRQVFSRLSPCVVVAILQQGLDFIDGQRIQLGRNHLHVLRVIRALRLDGEEVRLGGELHEFRLVFQELHFANIEFFSLGRSPLARVGLYFMGCPVHSVPVQPHKTAPQRRPKGSLSLTQLSSSISKFYQFAKKQI